MSRSVSAPSSVTNTSPCWNGLIVPGSTLMYGSNFCICTFSPRAFSRRPSDAAEMPLPRDDTTPPVTKTYFVGRRATTRAPGGRGARAPGSARSAHRGSGSRRGGSGLRALQSPACGPGVEVVGEADRGHARLAHREDPADERQAEAAVVLGQRAAGEDGVEKLAGPVGEAARIAAGRAVAQWELHLLDFEPLPGRVDRHPHLAAEPRRGRKAGGAGSRGKRALAGERLARLEAGAGADERASSPLGDPEASAPALSERGDGEIRVDLDERREVALEVGVAEEQRPGPGLALGEGERLTLPEPRQPDHPRASLLRNS